MILALAGAALVSRRRAPAALSALEALAGCVYLARDYPYGPLLVIVGVAAYAVARHQTAAATLLAVGPAALGLVVAYVIGFEPKGVLGVAYAVAQAGWVLGPAFVGGLVHEALHADAEAAAGREERERLRMAQEVHDVVGHGLSVISLQAGVALHVLERAPIKSSRRSKQSVPRASRHLKSSAPRLSPTPPAGSRRRTRSAPRDSRAGPVGRLGGRA